MNNPLFPVSYFQFFRLIALSVCLVWATAFHVEANGPSALPDLVPVRVVTASDSVYVGEIEDFTFQFLAIDDAGQSSHRELRLSEIDSLHVVAQPEADSMTGINEMIMGLGNPDYQLREESESRLSKETGRAEVRTLLEKAMKHELLEVRYRSERLLSTAGASVKPAPERWEYDRVRMTDGTELRGDAGKFPIQLVSRGEKMELERGDFRAILVGRSNTEARPADEEFRLPVIRHEFQNQTYPVMLDFESGIAGRKLMRTANIAREFTDHGLLLFGQPAESDRSGAILISPYAFNFENKPTGGNSICVSRDAEALRSPHKGITVMYFCLPKQPGVPGGVTGLGMFAARTEYAFSFVLQCFNEDGQLLAEVASSDEMCSWFEVESIEPVVTARFLANPLGLRMELPIDEDYAIDNLGITSPVPAMPLEAPENGTICLHSGELFQIGQITFGESGIAAREPDGGRLMQFELVEIAWWIVPKSPMILPKRGEARWFAMLDDRSVLEVKWHNDQLVPVRWTDISFDQDSLIGLWTGQDWCRFPEAADFGFGKNLLVFPGCRLAVPNTAFNETGISWKAGEAVPLFQPLKVTARPSSVEDPTGANLAARKELAPSFETVAWDEVSEWNLPTVWLQKPPAPDRTQGSLSLNSGEKIVFGPKSRFRMDVTSAEGARMIDAAGTTFTIEWKDVRRVKMPDVLK